jgi:hypothetical protein
MKAKTVNFERGLNPKQSMGTGGIALGKLLWDRKEEYKKMWKDEIINMFQGKTVSGLMHKYVVGKDDNDMIFPKYVETKKYTVKADSVIVSDVTLSGDYAEREGLPANITLMNKERTEFYVLDVSDKKININ